MARTNRRPSLEVALACGIVIEGFYYDDGGVEEAEGGGGGGADGGTGAAGVEGGQEAVPEVTAGDEAGGGEGGGGRGGGNGGVATGGAAVGATTRRQLGSKEEEEGGLVRATSRASAVSSGAGEEGGDAESEGTGGEERPTVLPDATGKSVSVVLAGPEEEKRSETMGRTGSIQVGGGEALAVSENSCPPSIQHQMSRSHALTPPPNPFHHLLHLLSRSSSSLSCASHETSRVLLVHVSSPFVSSVRCFDIKRMRGS